uniref:GDP/GTP exchange factor Sec2 N-terminal domain-containing protein n=1 Tax=Ciona savignyi TaxID=51511 RepID=H2YGK9_CIOSA
MTSLLSERNLVDEVNEESSESGSWGSVNCSFNHNTNSINDTTFMAMEIELDKTKQDLKEKSAECEKLQSVRAKVDRELEDLTASLFEEANKMVYDANMKRHKAEKKVTEANGLIEALRLEVEALKSLVITSTPSNPNPTSHPQLIKRKEASPIKSLKLPKNWSKEKLKDSTTLEIPKQEFKVNQPIDFNVQKEVDSTLQAELSSWLEANLSSRKGCGCGRQTVQQMSQCVGMSQSTFLQRVLKEDMTPCLDFNNGELSDQVSKSIHSNSLSVEAIPCSEEVLKCSLTKTTTKC